MTRGENAVNELPNMSSNEQRFWTILGLLVAAISAWLAYLALVKPVSVPRPPLPATLEVVPKKRSTGASQPQVPSVPVPAEAKVPRTQFSSEFGQWWPENTPQAPDQVTAVESRMWEFISTHKGSCEPLRQYQNWYPNGEHTAETNRRLKSVSHRTEVRQKIIDEPHGRSIIEENYEEKFDERKFCASLRSKVRGPDAACAGAEAAMKFVGLKNVLLNSFVDEKTQKCTCSRNFFGQWSCEMEWTGYCRFNKHVSFRLENCGS